MRDWTVDVAQNDYSHLLDLLDEHEQGQLENRAMTTVLVPGSGLGRLAYEILKSGRKVEALDSSISMIAATRTIVHDLLMTKKDSHELDKAEETLLIYPFVDQTSNLFRHQYRTKKFELLTHSDRNVLTSRWTGTGTGKTNKNIADQLTLIHGEFKHVAMNQASLVTDELYDVIVTSYFVDMQTNVLRCIDDLFALLNPGGIWINEGPLKFGLDAEVAVAGDTLLLYARSIGFNVLHLSTAEEVSAVNSQQYVFLESQYVMEHQHYSPLTFVMMK